MAQSAKNLPAVQDTRVPSLSHEDPLEKKIYLFRFANGWIPKPTYVLKNLGLMVTEVQTYGGVPVQSESVSCSVTSNSL